MPGAIGTFIVNDYRFSFVKRACAALLFSFGEKRKKNPTQEKRNPQVSELCTSFEFNYEAMPHTSQRLVIAPVRVL